MSQISFAADSALDDYLDSLDIWRCRSCQDKFDINVAIMDEENDKNIICPLCGASLEYWK